MKKRDWSKYNKALVERGNVTFYIDENILKRDRKMKTFGRPRIFSHPLIQLLLILKIQYSLSYRMLEGFAKNTLSYLYPKISLPSYSVICRRAAELKDELPKLSSRKPQSILIDATGIKVYGEGEWKVKVQGKTKRRKWIKLHAGIDERTQEVIVLEVTPGNVADCKAGKKVIEKLPKSMKMLTADTGYDTRNIRNLIRKKGAKSLIPPRKNAVKKGEDEERDDAVCEMRGFGRDRIGRSLWGKITGYSYRTLVESCFSRFKRLFSASFFSRGMVRQTVEGNLKCYMLNKMVQQMA